MTQKMPNVFNKLDLSLNFYQYRNDVFRLKTQKKIRRKKIADQAELRIIGRFYVFSYKLKKFSRKRRLHEKTSTNSMKFLR